MDQKEKIIELISLGEKSLNEEHRTPGPGIIMPDYISGPIYLNWLNSTHLFAMREMGNHPFSDRIVEICKDKNESISDAEELLSYLKTLKEDDAFLFEGKTKKEIPHNTKVDNKKVFIVHGHDEAAINVVARALEHDSFEPVILREQPDNGKTIIEKIEENSDVGYAVVLYTPCDEGRDALKKDEPLKKRARQNVVFEHGYLMGHLGRSKVAALVKGNVETPGDISGVVYIQLDDAGAWKLQLVKNMNAAGLNANANNWL